MQHPPPRLHVRQKNSTNVNHRPTVTPPPPPPCPPSYNNNNIITPKYVENLPPITNSPTVGSVDQPSNHVPTRDVHVVPPSPPMIGVNSHWGGVDVRYNVSRHKVPCIRPRFVIRIVSSRRGRHSIRFISRLWMGIIRTFHRRGVPRPFGNERGVIVMMIGVWGVRIVLGRVCRLRIMMAIIYPLHLEKLVSMVE